MEFNAFFSSKIKINQLNLITYFLNRINNFIFLKKQFQINMFHI